MRDEWQAYVSRPSVSMDEIFQNLRDRTGQDWKLHREYCLGMLGYMDVRSGNLIRTVFVLNNNLGPPRLRGVLMTKKGES